MHMSAGSPDSSDRHAMPRAASHESAPTSTLRGHAREHAVDACALAPDIASCAGKHGFTLLHASNLPEIDGAAFVMHHDASGARLLYLRNDDNNKAFSIGFRTPPADDTGVFHILEHSVLCGSDRFPVKEPFVDLLKGSMQTFLNAMTFPDKTMYPVASTNEQDLYNLMDVYLDAVFHPIIYRKRAIFEQEGWHYELRRAQPATDAAAGEAQAAAAHAEDIAALPAGETELVHNGVVYNEMKGALSDASSVLFDELQRALFPGTCYAFESGGTPRAIPTLTYENYLDEHRRHYRLDNSYTVLYGNLDVERALAFLDERHFTPAGEEQRGGCAHSHAPADADADGHAGASRAVATGSHATAQVGTAPETHAAPRAEADAAASTPAPRTISLAAPIVREGIVRNMDTAPENACAGAAFVVGTYADRERVCAANILVDALFGSNEAPLKRALLDAGVADDISCYLADSLLQPFAIVEARMPHGDAGANLAGIMKEALTHLIAGADGHPGALGIAPELIEASLSRAEFVMREHDFGIADGVALAISSLAGWLYDDDPAQATSYLRYANTFARLRARIDTGWFDALARELFLENDHVASVEVIPCPGLGADDPNADPPEALARLNDCLSRAERMRIVAGEEALRTFQTTPDSPEKKACLPRLGIADIADAPAEPPYELDSNAIVPVVRHHVPTRQIAYLYRYFDANRLSFEDLPWASVLALVLGKLGTARHSAAQIDTLVQGKLGNLSFFTDIFQTEDSVEHVDLKFTIGASALSENVAWLATLPREIALETDFSDTGKILTILAQRKIVMEQSFAQAGHASALARARSYCTPSGVVAEQLGNVGFYRFLTDLLAHFDERANEVSARLAACARTLFTDEGCTMSFAGTDEDYERLWTAGPSVQTTAAPERAEGAPRLVIPRPQVRREAFIVPTDVCFAAQGFDRRIAGAPYAGMHAVAARAVSLDYLWNEVRVKGGAYGVGFQSALSGDMCFYSYRDPHLDRTLTCFARTPAWLSTFDPMPADWEGFVVSTVAAIDAPLKAREVIRRQDRDFFSKRDPQERARVRQEAIDADARAVRSLASLVERAVETQAVCVFGNRSILEESKAEFELIDLLA